MAKRYADRAFISVNGTPVFDIQSSSLKQNHNAKAVPSMTRDGHNAGFVKGNRDIDITIAIAIQNGSPRPKFELSDYEANDAQITYIVGSERFIATGLFLKDNEDASSGVGNESTATFNFGALKLLDAVGNNALFDLVL